MPSQCPGYVSKQVDALDLRRAHFPPSTGRQQNDYCIYALSTFRRFPIFGAVLFMFVVQPPMFDLEEGLRLPCSCCHLDILDNKVIGCICEGDSINCNDSEGNLICGDDCLADLMLCSNCLADSLVSERFTI